VALRDVTAQAERLGSDHSRRESDIESEPGIKERLTPEELPAPWRSEPDYG
jgi:hypothetical protein